MRTRLFSSPQQRICCYYFFTGRVDCSTKSIYDLLLKKYLFMGLVQKILVASLHNTLYTLWNKWRTRGKRSLFCLEDAPPMTGGVMYDCVEVCFPVLWWWLPLWRNGKGQKVCPSSPVLFFLRQRRDIDPLCTDCCTVTRFAVDQGTAVCYSAVLDWRKGSSRACPSPDLLFVWF
jgi:hypothetical protein